MDFSLPISAIVPEVIEKLRDNQCIVITAPPGTGKSTLLPIEVYQQFVSADAGKKILMLEPRRLAARSIASRMSDMLGEKVGQTVGYRVRFESVVSNNTRIEVLTEGILTRMLQTDNELKDVSVIIFDEFHERSLNADLALALVRECQQILRPDLKIVIMSATIDCDKISQMLDAPVISAESKMYDVEISYEGNVDPQNCAELTAITIARVLSKREGDILAFLPGEGDILKCEELLQKSIDPEIRIHPLYGMLPIHKQAEAIMPDKQGRRKIVLATSIAETSLTIQGVKIVVDSGLCKIQKYDSDTALSRLETVKISMDMADQRAGRAGRLSNGYCYRLWNKGENQYMLPNRRPEIEYADLTQLVLDLARWGENNPENLQWLTPPDRKNVLQARDLLQKLDALDDDGNITKSGIELSKIPTHPRIAKMLMVAKQNGLSALAADISAILDNRDPLPKEESVDFNLRIEALRRNRRDNRHNPALDNIERNAVQYRKMFGCKVDNEPFDSYDTGLLLAEAFPERIASARPGNNARFLMTNGNLAMMDYKDPLAGEAWIAIASLNAREGLGKIFLASPLDPKSLAPMIKTRDTITWNTKKGGVVAVSQVRLGCIVLQEKPLKNADPELIEEAILNAIVKEGDVILDWNDDVQNLQNRILSLRKWNPEQEWPDVSTETLTATCKDWITPYLSNVRTTEQLKKIDLLDA
ncbi:MAG: ATP-dependent helicase HrpB, partial [Bacteroidales bacterium]|nr:ATP-dependent helicase HrpB [Bacteroidales bacterium]